MKEILYKDLSYEIVGAAMEVHRILGPGFLEAVYQKALAHELTLRRISHQEFIKIPVKYKDIIVGEYEADFLVDDKIILELKAVSELHPQHFSQALNYLAATGHRLAILMNFGSTSLQSQRVVR